MPRYMLDTNMVIYLMKNQPESVAKRFAQCFVGDVVMSAITFAELEYGVEACTDPARERQKLLALTEDIPVLSFDQKAAIAYGPIHQAMRDSEKDHFDKLIAAHAVALNVVLVTNNLRDFAKYPGLQSENWIESP